MCSQAHLLTVGCGEGGFSIHCKVLNVGPSKDIRQLVLKRPNPLMAFREEFLKATFGVRVAGGMTFFWMIFQES